VFWFSLQLLFEKFLILRRTEQNIIKLHVNYELFGADYKETWIFWIDFRKILRYQTTQNYVQGEPSCSIDNFPEIVKALLKHNAVVGKQNDQGDTVLHLAVIGQNLDIVQNMLVNGANPNIRNW
jgi:FOG: Ankyrin repeat